jgi:AraC-like DNA-binding protein
VVILEQVPDYTPAADSIFLVGSFNNWNNHDANFRFLPQPDGSYVFRFLTPMPDFEYKINRGNWKTVEGGEYGQAIDNHIYKSNNALNDTIRTSVLSWEDFPDYIPFWDTLRMCVTAIPDNTPADAALYVAGSFNGWMPGDPNYKMHRDSTGAWVATIPIRTKVTDFKISRGSWSNIETLQDGKARPNRRFIYGEDTPAELLALEVEDWYDLSSYQMTWYAVFLLLATLQCVLLLVAINSLRDRNKVANRILSALIIVISATFLARLAGLNQANFEQFPKLILLPDMVYFIYGPLFLAYLYALLPAWQRPRTGLFALHFVPLVLALGVYAPLFMQEPHAFVLAVANLEYRPLFIWAAVLGWLFNVYYWYRSFGLLRRFAPPSGRAGMRRFVLTVFYVHTLCLVFWLAAFVVGGVAKSGDYDGAATVDALINLIWVTLALGIYTLGYYMMRQPQLFQQASLPAGELALHIPIIKEVRRPEKPETERHERNTLDDDDEKAQQLEDHMRTAHPYLNPGLSLAELADGIAIPTHQLSRLINDRFDKNFFDYVNGYRIEAFKTHIERGDHETRTILSLALDAGFNSKTAFNRAFKKHTGMTPREYLVQEKKRTEV